ncbi:protein of unknown function [Azotobacter beijerinckii]|uniref:IrrE N-terminal-like domain-containing protein n=1 Tax=Azotobacter beijerinckii TaxID=170623 RepID=A0A1H6QEL2_9GAMM|nr:ImmA/IrrE family metallo-endopeptidase [Azotobacter beijerinckii]SEI39384.1 protein of unknown function [Azotobacter beijerinckii]SEI51509.1 protein of unknown function [Azotobacter beijerinckii]
MTEFICFGSPDEFEISVRWIKDKEPRALRPLREGWSAGELKITVCHQILTEHDFRGKRCSHISWYLLPVIEWLIKSWRWMLHEEKYLWVDKYGQPGAVATFSVMEKTLGSSDEVDFNTYQNAHAWWSRHALRASDASAILPDIYIRRFADDIEVSWLSRQPDYAPADFCLKLSPGSALLPVKSVAEPLWGFLEWVTRSAPAEIDSDNRVVEGLRKEFRELKEIPTAEFELGYIGKKLQGFINSARSVLSLESDQKVSESIPVIESFDSAVLMFGGLNVEIERGDVDTILRFISKQKGGGDSDKVSGLVKNPEVEMWGVPPYEEGYRLAESLRDELGIPPCQAFMDVDKIFEELGIDVVEANLETNSIRGIAIAGKRFSPAIMVNKKSPYNRNDVGKRFTLAHELCHILYDRTRARKLSHLSGPWASARTEKRANAFAAMFLASTSAIREKLSEISISTISELAGIMGVGISGLVEHLYNIEIINDVEREELRASLNA